MLNKQQALHTKIARKDFYYAYNMLYCTPFVQPFLIFTRIYIAKFITLHIIVSRYISASSLEWAYRPRYRMALLFIH